MSQLFSYADAVNQALFEAMTSDPSVLCFGLGVPDPKAVFGTTSGLADAFGPQRVFDMPASENGMTGIAIGAAISGMRPVMVHQRLDFFLLALDQLVNNAAKWRYMFGGQTGVPITIRLILGRGWGQGPTHSQSLQSWFAHVPGLKVVMPALPADAKGLLSSAIFDDDPVVFLEHRWLHNTEGKLPAGPYRTPIGRAARLREGDDATIVSMSYMTIEALAAVDHLAKQGIHCDLIDLRTVRPIDWEMVLGSAKRTGRLLVLDTGWTTGSLAGEIVARASMELWHELRQAPQRLALPDVPTPTSQALADGFYPEATDVVAAVARLLDTTIDGPSLPRRSPHDVPGTWFKGPF